MNKERLIILADYLQTLPPENLDMHSWTCGTAACAVGHACTLPEFKAEGFSLHTDSVCNYPALKLTFHETLTGWNAVVKFFSLNRRAAYYLFDFISYVGDPSPTYVSDRIRAYVINGSAVNTDGGTI